MMSQLSSTAQQNWRRMNNTASQGEHSKARQQAKGLTFPQATCKHKRSEQEHQHQAMELSDAETRNAPRH